jgi:hypothetical protein
MVNAIERRLVFPKRACSCVLLHARVRLSSHCFTCVLHEWNESSLELTPHTHTQHANVCARSGAQRQGRLPSTSSSLHLETHPRRRGQQPGALPCTFCRRTRLYPRCFSSLSCPRRSRCEVSTSIHISFNHTPMQLDGLKLSLSARPSLHLLPRALSRSPCALSFELHYVLCRWCRFALICARDLVFYGPHAHSRANLRCVQLLFVSLPLSLFRSPARSMCTQVPRSTLTGMKCLLIRIGADSTSRATWV